MSVTSTSKVFWTDIGNLSYADKNGKKVTVQASTCKIVLLAIADNANDYGENSWQSFDTLAKKSSLEKRTVIRAIRALVENKYLILCGISEYGTNNYTLNMGVLGEQPPRRRRGASDSTSLLERAASDSGAPASDSGAPASDSGAPASDVKSPEPYLTSLNQNIKENKERLFKDLESAASQVFGNDVTSWRKLAKELEHPEVALCREDGRFTITGIGQKAAMFQDRYAKSFSRVLCGIYDHPTEVVFLEMAK